MSGPVSYLDRIFTEMTSILLIPFRGLPPVYGLAWLSLIAGVCMILLFRWLSDQDAIASLRRKMGAQALGMLLYMTSPRTVVSMAGRLIASNMKYLLLVLKPLLVIAIPFVVLLGQTEARYSTEPLQSGEYVTVTLGWDGAMPSREEFSVIAANAAVIDPPVFVPALGEVSFRLEPSGTGPVVIESGGASLPVGPTASWPGSVSAREYDSGTPFSRLLRPWNVRPDIFDARLASPDRGQVFLEPVRYHVLGGRWSWLAVLLAVSTLSAIAGAAVFRVRV
jgi:hypothetical protein